MDSSTAVPGSGERGRRSGEGRGRQPKFGVDGGNTCDSTDQSRREDRRLGQRAQRQGWGLGVKAGRVPQQARERNATNNTGNAAAWQAKRGAAHRRRRRCLFACKCYMFSKDRRTSTSIADKKGHTRSTAAAAAAAASTASPANPPQNTRHNRREHCAFAGGRGRGTKFQAARNKRARERETSGIHLPPLSPVFSRHCHSTARPTMGNAS